MSSSVLSIAVSGLQAAQSGLATTGHNIANVNTPGYSRQAAIQEASPGVFSGTGYYGRGASVATVVRHYDGLLAAQARGAQSAAAHYAAAQAQSAAVDNLLADPAMGLQTALAGFFAGVNTLAAHPGDAAARQSMLSASHSLVARFQSLDAAIAARQQGTDRRLEATVASINALARQVADLNQRIGREAGAGQPPNDLLDRRDAVVRELAKLAGATTAEQSDGALNVYLGNGQALVVGAVASTLQAGADGFDPARRVVGLATGGGFVEFSADTLFGGELGGLLAARRDVLDPARNALGRIAVVLADAFNAQHRLGQDRAGVAGGDFFALAAPRIASAAGNGGTAQLAATFADTGALTGSDYTLTYGAGGWTVKRASDGASQVFAALPATVDGIAIAAVAGVPVPGDRFQLRPTRDGAGALAVRVADPARIAAASPIRTAAAPANQGTGTVSAGTVLAADPDLAQAVTLTFTSAGTFDVAGAGTGNPAGLAYTPGMTVSWNGWEISLDGQPAAGDSFTIGPNLGGTGDNRNALALAALQSARLVGGEATANESYAALVSAVGAATHEAASAAAAQAALAADADQAVQRISGVNLDEEAASLLRFQQAYQAAGRVIQSATVLFDTLLSLGNR